MTNKPSFNEIYMNLALSMAKRSHCVKIGVGAVLVKDSRIVSVGYNGPPSGTHNCDEEWPGVGCEKDRKGSCSLALHAEENAILYALKNGSDLNGATLYLTLSPCLPCARTILTSGIKHVIYYSLYSEYKKIECEEGIDFLKKFGITIEKYSIN